MEATINNTSKSAVISRINELKEHLGYSQARLAERCGLSKSNFCKMLGGSQTITDQTLHRLADEFGVSFRWLRNGLGEMFAEEKAIGKAQFAAFSQMLDANTSPVSQNIISGDNYQGTQTINGTEGEIVALRQKVELLRRLLDEKDKLLEEKDKLIKEKDKQNSDKNERLTEKDKMIAEQSNVIVEQRKQLQTLMEIFGKNKD